MKEKNKPFLMRLLLFVILGLPLLIISMIFLILRLLFTLLIEIPWEIGSETHDNIIRKLNLYLTNFNKKYNNKL